MSANPQTIFKPAYSEAIISDDLADLTLIYQDSVNICQINRAIDSGIEAFIGELLQSAVDIGVIENLPVNTFDFSRLIPAARHIEGYAAFCHDIAHLTTLFCDLFDLKRVGLRLRTLDRPMCPKFHVDAVPCRLVSTYGGIGTEWLEDKEVKRIKPVLVRHDSKDDPSGTVRDSSFIHTMPAFSVGLLKGSNWTGNELHGAVHRSPKLSADLPRRLLLTLDFA
ncbi:DUF1826 domain-containing protein [Methylicorpusculum oleiharenae]|uniref:DUF1826 domain-containing protein n=1 Tax=Methylicorpusculum oleiharenae TaxID=1338687 RepID=UPI001357B32C|nr:DUF1826 domain-containing protein [Methylicorpusculum oleiharenae]MCD2449564.1 DUF1826 domain-containing protein [Methylicorpusculum oleiharenae]